MKKGWKLIALGIVLIVMCPLLIRGVTTLKPAAGPDGLVHLEYDQVATLLTNWDAWLCLLAGFACIVAGTILNLKKRQIAEPSL